MLSVRWGCAVILAAAVMLRAGEDYKLGPDSEVQAEGSKESVVALTWKAKYFRSFRGTKSVEHCYGAPSN